MDGIARTLAAHRAEFGPAHFLSEIISANSLNMLAVLKSGDIPSGRLMFQPDAENVASGIYVPVMGRSALAAFPASHSKRAHTFRAASGDCPASRARLGTVSFVCLDKHGSVPSGLVAEHVSERTPACVEHGLSHPCLGEAGGVHIADNDQTVLADNPGGLLVEMVPPCVGDLRMDGANPLLVAGALSGREFGFVTPVVLEGRNLLAVRKGGQVFQAQVDTDRTVAGGQIVGHLALNDHVPAATRILDKVTEAESAFNVARLPKMEAALEVHGGVTIELRCARNERYPTKCALSAEAGAEARAPAVCVAALCELTANLRHRIGVKSKVGGHAFRELVQIERGWPADAPIADLASLCLPLGRNAEVPDLIAGNRVLPEMPVSVLDAELVADDAQGRPGLSCSSFVSFSQDGRNQRQQEESLG